jgi:hypothetical protein
MQKNDIRCNRHYAVTFLCSADLLVGCAGGVLAARSEPRFSIQFAHNVTKPTAAAWMTG